MWALIWVFGLFFSLSLQAQIKWDGGANTSNWNDGMNWFPDLVPGISDDVVLDNSIVSGSYMVMLPSGTSTTIIRSLRIQPLGGVISIELPASNIANPGLSLTGTGNVLMIHDGAIFRNASGASSGSGISVTGFIHIYNGGRYVHQTPRSNAGIIDQLSTEAGTEKGIFEFDIPGGAGYTLSLTGNNFGSLYFRASAAGGLKSYSGSGSGTLTIRGDLSIDVGAQVTSTLTADVVIAGNLTVDGKLSLNPTTIGTVARSLRFIGGSSKLQGSGIIQMNAAFRNIEVARNASLQLERSLSLTQSTHNFIGRGNIKLGHFFIEGPGAFILTDTATLQTADVFGITSSLDLGSVRTALRSFSSRANYIYNGSIQQQTGDALPDSVSSLGINNPQGLLLSRKTYIRDSLLLTDGKIITTLQSLLTIGSSLIKSNFNRYGQTDEGNEQSFIHGPIGLNLDEDQLIIAPIGWDSVFAPLRIRKKDPGSKSVILSYHLGEHPDQNIGLPLFAISKKEYWRFEEPVSASIELELSYRPWSVVRDPLSTFAIGIHTGSWTGRKAIISGTEYGWLRADTPFTAITAAAPALVLDPTILPLGIMGFSAREEHDKIKLIWEAEEDQVNTVYEIFRSGDGRQFTSIGTIYSSGRNSVRHTWDDMDPLPLNYYQLHMKTGNTIYKSRVIRKLLGQKMARIFPNPAQEELNINFQGSRSRYDVEIVSFNGIVCKKFVCNTATCRIRVGDLKRGVYLIRFKDRSGSVTLPFAKD